MCLVCLPWQYLRLSLSPPLTQANILGRVRIACYSIFVLFFVFVSLWSAVLIFKVYKCSTCIKFFYREKVRGKFYIPMLQTSRMAVLLIFSSSFHFWYSQSNQVLNLRVVRSRDPSLKWPILKLQWNTSPWELGTSLLWRNVSQHTLYGVQHIHSNLTLIDCIF